MGATSRLALATAGVVVLATTLGGCAGDDSRQGSERFWESMRVEGDEVEPFGSIPDMAERSDAVVVGEFGSLVGDRSAGDSAPVNYVQVELRVDEVIAGEVGSDVIVMEFLASGDPGTLLPDEQVLVFLRAKRGAGEDGLWRAINSRGLWSATSRADIDTPLNPEPPAEDDRYADLVQQADSITDIAGFASP